jgi:hypothetical protein
MGDDVDSRGSASTNVPNMPGCFTVSRRLRKRLPRHSCPVADEQLIELGRERFADAKPFGGKRNDPVERSPASTYANAHLAPLLAVRPDIGAVAVLTQGFTVKDGDDASFVGNEAAAFECLQRNRHSRALRAKHQAKELVR